MKAVILAGGFGTRISEESDFIPKPMIEIGGRPILWHIMKIYSAHGVNEFVICCGYKGYIIKEYFSNYLLHTTDITFDYAKNSVEYHDSSTEPWRITLVDTGLDTMTGGRLKRIRRHVENEPYFHFTYGDGLADIDIRELERFHLAHGHVATMTATTPPGRFGIVSLEGIRVRRFKEKAQGDDSFINGGFFVLSPQAIDYVQDDTTVWEHSPLEDMARDGELHAFRHAGFWQPMDTLRDKRTLQELWESGAPPWKVWT